MWYAWMRSFVCIYACMYYVRLLALVCAHEVRLSVCLLVCAFALACVKTRITLYMSQQYITSSASVEVLNCRRHFHRVKSGGQ